MRVSSFGGLLLGLGLVMLGLFSFAVDLPSGLDFVAILALGIVPAVVGLALLSAGRRRSKKKSDPDAQRLEGLKEQIVWRAIAIGGAITSAEVIAHTGASPADADYALMLLVSEGRAQVEPGAAGEILYRIESSLVGDS